MHKQNARRGFTRFFPVPLAGKVARSADGGLSNRKTSFHTRLTAVLPQSGKTYSTTLLPGYAVLPPQGGQIERHNRNLVSQGQEITAHGFTFIELLVVVLIIGILAAIAVPQYQVAVKKAQLARLIPLVKTLANAEEAYYLANGEYTANLAALDIDLPAPDECIYTPGTTAGYYACNRGTDYYYKYGVYDGPNNAQAGISKLAYAYFLVDDTSYFKRAKKGDIVCFSKGEIARKVCKTLGPGEEKADKSSSWDYYYKLD